ncbi:MAG: hypothetical protein KME30_01805 [Iphinoe sp. HA4291-MV1]|nr:hypothetical protein [Iphinoe sp. HA4291-MV1]
MWSIIGWWAMGKMGNGQWALSIPLPTGFDHTHLKLRMYVRDISKNWCGDKEMTLD